MKDRASNLLWIPLWIDKWLFGSTRIEFEPAERAIWVDLIALGAKDSGHIRANVSVPYSREQLAGLLCISTELLEITIKKSIDFRKLILLKDNTLYIKNWNKYMLSDRHKRRFTKVRRLKKADTMSPKADTMSPKADTMSPKADTMSPKADTMSPKADAKSRAKQSKAEDKKEYFKEAKEGGMGKIGTVNTPFLEEVKDEKEMFLLHKYHLQKQCEILINTFKDRENGQDFDPLKFIKAAVKAEIPVEVYKKILDSMVKQKNKIQKPKAWIIAVLKREERGYHYSEALKKHYEVKNQSVPESAREIFK